MEILVNIFLLIFFNSGRQCPSPKTRSCVYSGPQTIIVGSSAGMWSTNDQCEERRRTSLPSRQLSNYIGESHETFAMASLCQYEPLQLTVGDVLVFNKSQPSDDVFAVPSQWLYAHCNFSDGGMQLESSTNTLAEVRYTIREEDKDTRLYLASSRDSACSLGQRVLVSVDAFKQGTLAEVVDLVEKEIYLTEMGAIHLIERIW